MQPFDADGMSSMTLATATGNAQPPVAPIPTFAQLTVPELEELVVAAVDVLAEVVVVDVLVVDVLVTELVAVAVVDPPWPPVEVLAPLEDVAAPPLDELMLTLMLELAPAPGPVVVAEAAPPVPVLVFPSSSPRIC
jgi:hypothetical protein